MTTTTTVAPAIQEGASETHGSTALPVSAISGNAYNGKNMQLLLTAQLMYGYKSNVWYTYRYARVMNLKPIDYDRDGVAICKVIGGEENGEGGKKKQWHGVVGAMVFNRDRLREMTPEEIEKAGAKVAQYKNKMVPANA